MNFNEYQTIAKTTAIYPRTDALVYPVLGLTGEAGEIANKVKKVIRDNEGVLSEKSRQSILDELGDVLWYVSALASDLDVSLEDVAHRNVVKLQKRMDKGTLGGSGDER